jgi:quinol monooxygenase YgiN
VNEIQDGWLLAEMRRMGNLSPDTSCSLMPYFKVHAGKLDDFKMLCERFVETTRPEPGCLYYGFSFDGDVAFCREAYVDAEAVLAHVQTVGALLVEAAKISDMIRLEIHGPESEIAKLRGPAASLNPQFFVVECGFRKS